MNYMENTAIQKSIDPAIAGIINRQIDKIREIVDAHGGGVEIIEATQEQAVIKLKGHCAGCPLAPLTFGKVLNSNIKAELPNLKIKYTI
jgi:Fe-S cluster biogenesis protein NfuA